MNALPPADAAMFRCAVDEIYAALARHLVRCEAQGLSDDRVSVAWVRALGFWSGSLNVIEPAPPEDIVEALLAIAVTVAHADQLPARVQLAREMLELPRRPESSP